MKPKIYIIMPAYNESGMISEVIKDLHNHGYRNIVVVDDGSADRTAEIASRLRVKVVRHLLNRGQGAALQTGIDYALTHGADLIVTFDADGQHQAKDIKRMIQPIQNKKTEITLGSRFMHKTSNIPFLRKLYLKIGVLVFRVMYGIKLTDSHNGFRAFSRKAAQAIHIQADGMEHASEIPEQIQKKKLKFMEVPVDIKYTSYSLEHGQRSSHAFTIFFKMILKKLLN